MDIPFLKCISKIVIDNDARPIMNCINLDGRYGRGTFIGVGFIVLYYYLYLLLTI